MHLIEAIAEAAALVLLAILGRGIFVLFAPNRECRWCRPGALLGGSILAHGLGRKPERRRRGRRCWRCKGTRLTRRWGAYHVHKVKLSLIQAWEEREFWR